MVDKENLKERNRNNCNVLVNFNINNKPTIASFHSICQWDMCQTFSCMHVINRDVEASDVVSP